jgi:hypothetical protein
MYYHPKYYAEQRAKRRKLQAASLKQAIQETIPHCDIEEAAGVKRQAEPSSGSSKNLSKLQAPSGKRQA